MSSNRFYITYLVSTLADERLETKLQGIAIEQSIEMPATTVSEHIAASIVGKIGHPIQVSEQKYEVTISYPVENIGDDPTQFLNILLGNISLKPGIMVIGCQWEKTTAFLPGPTFGVEGIRTAWGIPHRGLSATALKPMGSTPQELAEKCSLFAKGHVDIIKDDHGLANQSYAPFTARLKACVSAVHQAYDETGFRSRYFPNITTSPSKVLDRFNEARDAGADGVLLCPSLVGLELMAELAQQDQPLPIMAHPAFAGSVVLANASGSGFSHGFLGELWRAFGADFVIYPNAGGRFSFSLEECRHINDACLTGRLPFKKCFPTPGGGIDASRMPFWLSSYGKNITYLIGGSLYGHPEGIEAASRELSSLLAES